MLSGIAPQPELHFNVKIDENSVHVGFAEVTAEVEFCPVREGRW